MRDRQLGTTERVSVSSDGLEGNGPAHGGVAVSADGRYIAFYSYASNLVTIDNNHLADVFVRDRQLNTTTLVTLTPSGTPSSGTGISCIPILDMSSDGRFVVFVSDAADLSAQDTNGVSDVFVRDMITHTTTRETNSSGKGVTPDPLICGPSITDDGRFVVYSSGTATIWFPMTLTLPRTYSSKTDRPGQPYVHQLPMMGHKEIEPVSSVTSPL